MANILVVEDHEMTRKVLERRLKKEGHQVIMASNGFAGLQMLEDEKVDLVILDFMMKTMNGIQTYEKMKEIKPWVPCVMVTAYAHAGLVKQFVDEGGADFLVKPIREDFEERINKVLQKVSDSNNDDDDDEDIDSTLEDLLDEM